MKIRNQKHVVIMKNGEHRAFKTWSTAKFFYQQHREDAERIVLVKG